MMPPSRFWTDIPTEAFGSAGIAKWIAVLPVAAIEQHGPHLPVGTDAVIGQAYLDQVLARLPDDLPAVFLPQQTVGKSDEHLAFPGTLTLSAAVAMQVWTEIGAALHRAGIRKVVMVSAHGGNIAPLEIVARELRVRFEMLAVYTAWDRLGHPPGLYTDEEIQFGIHAGEIETSIMLAARPELVDRRRGRKFFFRRPGYEPALAAAAHGPPGGFGWMAQDLNTAGAMGNAAAATADKGRASLIYGAERFIELLQDVKAFEMGPGWDVG